MRHRYRKRRADRRPDDWDGFEPPVQNAWTVEGQIEQLGRFARSVNHSTGWRRWAGKLMLTWPFLLWGVVGLGSLAVALLRWLL